jgi:hypothetical protein
MDLHEHLTLKNKCISNSDLMSLRTTVRNVRTDLVSFLEIAIFYVVEKVSKKSLNQHPETGSANLVAIYSNCHDGEQI